MAKVGVLILGTYSGNKKLDQQRKKLDQLGYYTSAVNVLSAPNPKPWHYFLTRLINCICLGHPKLCQKLAGKLDQWQIFADIKTKLNWLRYRIDCERIVIYAPSALAGLFAMLFVDQLDYEHEPFTVDKIVAFDVPLVPITSLEVGSRYARPHPSRMSCWFHLFYSGCQHRIVHSSLGRAVQLSRNNSALAVQYLEKTNFGFADGSARNFFGLRRYSAYWASYAFSAVCSVLLELQRASSRVGTLE